MDQVKELLTSAGSGTHALIVLGMGLAFFAVQLWLCGRFLGFVTRYRGAIRRLRRDLEQRGSGRRDINKLGYRYPWLGWVDDNFPTNEAPRGQYTRDDVLRELDATIAANSSYLLLQRMGVMAPLLGVLLTVMGFYFLEVPETSVGLGAIMAAVTPLVAGVGTGALLAIVNQGLLHVGGGAAEKLRLSARNWFDASVWNAIGTNDHMAMRHGEITAAMAKTVARATEVQGQLAEKLDAASASLADTITRLQKTLGPFAERMDQIPDSLLATRQSMSESSAALQKMVAVGQRAVAGLDVSVSAFRSTIDREFAASARTQHQNQQAVAEAVSQLTGFLAQLDPLTSRLDELNQSLARLQQHTTWLPELEQADQLARDVRKTLADVKRRVSSRKRAEHAEAATAFPPPIDDGTNEPIKDVWLRPTPR